MMKYLTTDNTSGAVRLKDIPEAAYAAFYDDLATKLADPRYHVAHYFALPDEGRMRFYCLLLDDQTGQLLVTSHSTEYYDDTALPSLTALHAQMHPFERDITERYGIRFDGQPWPKPLRFPAERYDRRSAMDNYPFYTMQGHSLHEVNVGPIHAGIIEPGAFRFICNGEQVLHLEIALGYQHRGVERAFETTANRLRQACLAEAVAGDSAVAHAAAFAETVERLTGFERPAQLDRERAVALELERMAMQIADTGALSTDVGYQLGQVACEALRTMTINTTQAWCGNRFGKGLVRPHGTDHPLTAEKAAMIRRNVGEIARRYEEIWRDIASSSAAPCRARRCCASAASGRRHAPAAWGATCGRRTPRAPMPSACTTNPSSRSRATSWPALRCAAARCSSRHATSTASWRSTRRSTPRRRTPARGPTTPPRCRPRRSRSGSLRGGAGRSATWP